MAAEHLIPYRAAQAAAANHRADTLARKLSAGQVALIRKGARGLFGIAYAGELLATARLGPDALDALAETAMTIAHEIRTASRSATVAERDAPLRTTVLNGEHAPLGAIAPNGNEDQESPLPAMAGNGEVESPSAAIAAFGFPQLELVPPAPAWAVVAKVKNRAVLDRLRDRYQLPRAA